MSPPRILVLGAGMVGGAVALDLAADNAVSTTIADIDAARLEAIGRRTTAATIQADLADPSVIRRLADSYDLVIGALPSVIGYQTVQAVIEAGRDCVDISFMADDVLALDAAARDRGVTVVADCGIAPGISNMMAGFAASQLRVCERVDIAVGGLPRERRWPYEYKAGFAPSDVLEEYVRPSRVVEGGRVVVKPALSDVTLIDFPGVGTLEAFITDGLRSLVGTIQADFMQERTLRYPGHANLMRALRETGFLAKEIIEVNGQRVRPLDVTSALLFPRWTFADGEADLTVMRVVVEGQDARAPRRYEWTVMDYYDPATGLRSMSRTTGFSAAIVARIVAQRRFRRPGVCAPELLGPAFLETVIMELRRRGVVVNQVVGASTDDVRS